MVEANHGDQVTLLSLGLGLKMMGRKNMQDMMRLVLINIYDVMNEHFDHEGLKAAIALDAITGTNMGPRSPNTVFTYIHRMVGEALGNQGVTQVMRGMGSLGGALLSTACALLPSAPPAPPAAVRCAPCGRPVVPRFRRTPASILRHNRRQWR